MAALGAQRPWAQAPVTFNQMAVNALLLGRASHALGHAALPGSVRCDELLAQTIAPDQRRVAAAGKHQAIVRTQQTASLAAQVSGKCRGVASSDATRCASDAR